jgi:hypothetical protein
MVIECINDWQRPRSRWAQDIGRFADRCRPRLDGGMPAPARQKITFAEMRAAGVRGLLVYCSDYRCSNWKAISGDRWPGDVRLSDLEPRFICEDCGKRGADVRPDFHWEETARKALSAGITNA